MTFPGQTAKLGPRSESLNPAQGREDLKVRSLPSISTAGTRDSGEAAEGAWPPAGLAWPSGLEDGREEALRPPEVCRVPAALTRSFYDPPAPPGREHLASRSLNRGALRPLSLMFPPGSSGHPPPPPPNPGGFLGVSLHGPDSHTVQQHLIYSGPRG